MATTEAALPHASATKLCTSCGADIRRQAIVCRECRCYQGWRWWGRLIGLSLPWLIAAASGGAFAWNFYARSLRSIDADVTLELKGIEQGGIQVLATNAGERLALVEVPVLLCDRDVASRPGDREGRYSVLKEQGGLSIIPHAPTLLKYTPENIKIVRDYHAKYPDALCRVQLGFTDGSTRIFVRNLVLSDEDLLLVFKRGTSLFKSSTQVHQAADRWQSPMPSRR